jgi:hypothetical protein
MLTLYRQAVRMASQVRAEFGFGPAESICPFDLADRMGVSARLVNAPSLEGMYFPSESAQIFVGALRPSGRQRFTCGHEIAHHVFGHGQCIEEVSRSAQANNSPNEVVANRFASALLMPKLAVLSAFQRYGIAPAKASSRDIWRVAQALGVGYTTLVNYLDIALGELPTQLASFHLKARLPAIRSDAIGFASESRDAWIIDSAWGSRSVDVSVGDIVTMPPTSSYDGACLEYVEGPKPHLVAVRPGTGKLMLPNGAYELRVRVSRHQYIGLAQYRHLPEDEEDE